MIVAASSGCTAASPSRRSSAAAGNSHAAAAASLSGHFIRCSQVLDENYFGLQLQGKPLQHPPAGQHVADAALGDARVQHAGRSRIVQVHRHAAIDRQCRIRQDRRDRRRQQDAHVLSRRAASTSRRSRLRTASVCASRPPPDKSAPDESATFVPPQVAAAHADELSRKHKRCHADSLRSGTRSNGTTGIMGPMDDSIRSHRSHKPP